MKNRILSIALALSLLAVVYSAVPTHAEVHYTGSVKTTDDTGAAKDFSYPFGRLSDRIGRKIVLLICYMFCGAVCVTFMFLQNYWLILFTFVLYGLHRAALEPVQKTLVAELTPPDNRASILGGYQMVIGLCALPASLIAGILWDSIGIETPFYLSLGLTVVSSVLLLFVKEKRPTSSK